MNVVIIEILTNEFFSLAIRAAALVGAGLVAAKLLRQRAASLRFAVILSSLAAVLLLPILGPAVPKSLVLRNLLPALERPAPVQAVTQPVAAASVRKPADTMRSSASPRQTLRSAKLPAPMWPAIVLLTWLAGALMLIFRFAFATRRLNKLVAQSMRLSDEAWMTPLSDAQTKLAMCRDVELRLHPDSIMPMTCGLRRPVILLPLEADSWEPARRADVLMHELAHIKRNDLAFDWIAQAAVILHWFNPLIWSARRALTIERERACDDLVLNAGADPSRYANYLLQATVDFQAASATAPCMARRSDLETRMVSIVDSECQRGSVSGTALATVVGLSFAALLALCAIALTAESSDVGDQVAQQHADATPQASRLTKPPELPAAATAGQRAAAPTQEEIDAELFARYASDSTLFRDQATLDNDPSDGLTIYDLLEALRSNSSINRAAAAKALGEFADPLVVAALVNALEDPSEKVREWAARSLGNVGDETAIPALAVSLNDPQGEVAEWSARSLGNLGRPESVDALMQSLTHKYPAVREWSARSLGDLGSARAVDSLIGALQDTDSEVRQWAVRALGDIGDPRAMDAVAALADDPDPEIREWSEYAVESIRQSAND